MWDSFLDGFGTLLAFFYSVIPNYGIAIVLVTVTVRLVLYPLTAKQARSMAAMQRLQPEIKKIQQKYKQDRQKLNEELMAFYKEHQINPLAGCLPLLLQFPVFIALFQVLRSPAKHIAGGTDLFRAFCPGVEQAAQCDEPVGLSFLSMDLSRGANASHGSFLDALPFFILIGLVIISGYFQSRQMTKLQKGRATPQSQIMTRVFPVFFGLISYSLPAGVVLYFLVSNLWQIGQQAVVFGRGESEAKQPTKQPGRGKTAVVEATSRESESSASGPPDVDAAAASEGDAEDDDQPAAAATGSNGAQKSQQSSTNRPSRSKSRKRKKRKRRR